MQAQKQQADLRTARRIHNAKKREVTRKAMKCQTADEFSDNPQQFQ
jgi:hypothetical protein